MNEKLKIGYFVKMYPRLSETFILNEILELERRGVDVTIFSLMKPNEGRFHPQVSEVKAPVIYLEGLPANKMWDRLGSQWSSIAPRRAYFWELFEQLMLARDNRGLDLFLKAALASTKLAELGIDHIHAHFASTPSTAAYFASRITGLNFSFTAHAKGIFRDAIDTGHLQQKMEAAQFVVTVTQYNHRHIYSKFPSLPEDKVKVIYNGIDLDLFKTDAQSQRQPGLILSVGRLVPKKGFPDLLSACSILKQQGMSFECAIIGDGEQRDFLESMIRDLGLGQFVNLVGPKTQREVLEYMKRAEVFVLPCTMDPDGNQDALPTVLLEALGAGCPVVSTIISGVPEIVDSEVNGLLVAPEDPPAIARAMARIITAPELAANLASRGRQKAEAMFDLKKNAAALEREFRNATLTGSHFKESRHETAGDTRSIEDTLFVA